MQISHPHELSFRTPWVDAWRPEFIGTLMFVVDNDQVLLIHKKTGHGAGMVNGPGGKLMPGESLLECAVRETREEVGVTPVAARCCMEMRFVELDGPQWLGFAFRADQYQGELVSTVEADPFWCAQDKIPYDNMWPDDAVWLPPLLAAADLNTGVSNFLFRDGELLAHEFVPEPSIWQDLRLHT